MRIFYRYSRGALSDSIFWPECPSLLYYNETFSCAPRHECCIFYELLIVHPVMNKSPALKLTQTAQTKKTKNEIFLKLCSLRFKFEVLGKFHKPSRDRIGQPPFRIALCVNRAGPFYLETRSIFHIPKQFYTYLVHVFFHTFWNTSLIHSAKLCTINLHWITSTTSSSHKY